MSGRQAGMIASEALAGRVAMVTGVTRGIGCAICAEVCPWDAITMYSYEEGLKIAPEVTLVHYEEEGSETDEAAPAAPELGMSIPSPLRSRFGRLALPFALLALGAGACERRLSEPTVAERAVPGPVFLLGFDGLDPRLVDRWEREGLLPSFARLRREGAVGAVSVPPDATPPPPASAVRPSAKQAEGLPSSARESERAGPQLPLHGDSQWNRTSICSPGSAS